MRKMTNGIHDLNMIIIITVYILISNIIMLILDKIALAIK